MLKLLKRILFGRELGDSLNEKKIVKIHGIRFMIKKVHMIDFLDGSSVLLQSFDIYKLKANSDVPQMTNIALKRLQKHYTDVFCASVISPKLVRKKEDAVGDAIFVDYLFTEWDLANGLYESIAEFTYGKKKFKQSTSLAKSS